MTINIKRIPGEDVYFIRDTGIARGRIKSVAITVRISTDRERAKYEVPYFIDSEIYTVDIYPNPEATTPYHNTSIKLRLPNMYSNIEEVLQKMIDNYEKI